jgi:hypothetical protein
MPAQVLWDVASVGELDGTYTVTWTVTGSTDVPMEIFVHKFATEEFTHVANAGDLQWPTAKDPLKAWYRLATASKNYPDLDTANAARTEVETDIQTLVDLYEAGLATFLAPESNTTDPTP